MTNDGLYSFDNMTLEEILALDDYDPSRDPCLLLEPIMVGLFAHQLAEFFLEKKEGKEGA